MGMMRQTPATSRVFDAIVVGSGISGGWAAKELTEQGLEVLLLERGRPVRHGADYVTEPRPFWQTDVRGRFAANLSGFSIRIQETVHMAVKLRLTRIGKKKQPQYRIVAADARSPRDGRFIEILGHYDPRQDPSALTVDNDKAVKWLSEGAQPTERVAKLLEISGAMEQVFGTYVEAAVV